MGFHFKTPSDWEIVRHSLYREEGEIEMVDRRRQRLSLTWKRWKKQPDMQATLDQVRENERITNPNRKVRILDGIGVWRGFSRGDLTRLMAWERQRKLWLDLVLLWPEEPDPDGEAAVAQSFEIGDEPPPARMTEAEVSRARPMRWRAFGIDMTVPPGWAFEEAEVQALLVKFQLHDARNPRRGLEVQRSAMADAWFDGNLETHIRTIAGPTRQIEFSGARYRGYDAVVGRSKEKTRIGTRLAIGPRDRTDLAWFDEDANAVYTVSTLARPRRALDPAEFSVEGYCTR